ncbi:MAG: hypothetical protein QM664_04885 [Flavihumibacter sp.]
MKNILFFLVLLAAGTATGQQIGMSDYLLMKKPNGKHMGAYFKGSPISFQLQNGIGIDGWIEDIRDDSVFVRQWNIQSYMTSLGTSKVDTVGYYIHKLRYTDIFSIVPKRKEGFRYVKNGSIFMIGGIGYAALNVINGAYLDEPITDSKNIRSLGIALGVAGGGFILSRIHRHKVRTGKQYIIQYMKMR